MLLNPGIDSRLISFREFYAKGVFTVRCDIIFEIKIALLDL